MKKDILFVIDMQNDFVSGSLGTKEAQSITQDVIQTIEHHRQKNNLIIYTMDTHESKIAPNKEEQLLPSHCIKGTKGQQLIHGLNPISSEEIIEKRSFVHEHLKEKMEQILKKHGLSQKEIGQITLIGICTDICVVSHALALRSIFADHPIVVLEKVCAGTTPENHNSALQVMKSCLIDIA